MRLTEKQIQAIREVFTAYFTPKDRIWLFGSRADVNQKGGDIDLYIETDCDDLTITMENKIVFLRELKKKIGDQKIDIVIKVKNSDHLPIYDEAKSTGIQLL